MCYLIKYNDYYLQSQNLCTWELTTCEKKAVKFEDMNKVTKQINELKRAKKTIDRYKINFNKIKIVEIEDKIIEPSIVEELQLNGIVKGITSNYDKLQKRKDILVEKLSIVDKKQTDVLHYIEFTTLNACNGFKAYKLLKDIRLERRDIKQELDKITAITRIFTSQIDTLEKAVNNIDDRKYEPRILTDLFERGI